MTEKIQSSKIISQGGLNTNNNYLYLSDASPGSATALTNFEPSLYGGYRRINGYRPLEETNPEVDPENGEGPILGVAIYGAVIIAARKQQDSNTYNFYSWSSGGAWIPYTTGLTLNSEGVTKLRYATFNFDGTNKIIFVDGVNNATMFDGTDWVSIDPSATGADYDNAGGNQALDAPKYITVFRNHIFMSGDAAAPHVVAHSSPNSEYDWTAASGSGQIFAGFPVVQIQPWRDSNFVFGTTNIKYIAAENTDFVIRDVTSNIGCIASDSVQEIGGSLVFLSQDGFRPIAGTEKIGDVQLETISKNIQQDVIELISSFSPDEVNSVVIRRKSQIRFFFSTNSTDSEDAKGILGAIVENNGAITWEWGKIIGIRTSCCTSAYIDNAEYILHGDYDGCVYRQEIGTTFNGEIIFGLYRTPFLDFGDTEVRKTFRGVNVFIRPEGPLTLTTQITYDWGVSGRQSPPVYISEEEGNFSIYGESVYGTGIYAAPSVPVRMNNVEGSAFSIQIAFTNATSSSYTIQGIVFEFSTDGRL